MSTNAVLEKGLSTLGCDVAQDYYQGAAKTYIVYSLLTTTPRISGDDVDLIAVDLVNVHIFTQGNYITLVNDARIALRKAGFCMDQTQCSYEPDTKYYHVVIVVRREHFTEMEE